MAQAPAPPPAVNPSNASRFDALERDVEEVRWHQRLGDIAEIDHISYTSLPSRRGANPTAQGAGNPLVVGARTFIPKKLDRTRKQPLLVFAHGGVHSKFAISYINVVREMIEQGYTVIAPDYRGSTGYGNDFYNDIDYGGRELDDVQEGLKWMLETYSWLDPKRVGAIGWSHGGLISLMNIFNHPETYAVAYAGVPVSDLVARMGYKSDGYRATFAAKGNLDKTAEDDVKEYVKRSPVSHAAKLATPLLIHTNTNDEDVNVLEVQHLIAVLKAEGKKFEYKVYQDAPGGHIFNRIDTKLARESRKEIWAFLARFLTPGK